MAGKGVWLPLFCLALRRASRITDVAGWLRLEALAASGLTRQPFPAAMTWPFLWRSRRQFFPHPSTLRMSFRQKARSSEAGKRDLATALVFNHALGQFPCPA